MIAVFLGLGLLFLFTEIKPEDFPTFPGLSTYREELGVTMLIYAVVRTGMVIWKLKREQRNELED